MTIQIITNTDKKVTVDTTVTNELKCESCVNVTDSTICDTCKNQSLYSTVDIQNAVTEVTKRAEMFYRGMDKELQVLEIEIRKGLRSFLTVGKNLAIIQEKTLYKTRGYDTFEQYCKEVLDVTRQQGYRLIRAYRLYTVLKDSYKGGKLPQTESQCRPLTDPDLSDLDVTLIWAIVVESGKITALNITNAVKEYKGEIKAPSEGENLPFNPDSKDSDTSVQGKDSIPVKSVNNASETKETKETKESGTDVTNEQGVPAIGTPAPKESEQGTVPTVTKGDIVAENLLLKAQIAQLELELAQAKVTNVSNSGIPRNKMSMMLFKTGYNVLLKTVSDDQKTELTELYNSLIGR